MRLLPAFLLLAPILALAETAYVTDNLRLGLHQAPDTSDRAFRTLQSGQEIEVLSRDRNYANVRLPDGVEGYVKAAYLVYEKPAKLIVEETQAEADRLAAELESLRASFAEPAATIDALEQTNEELEATLATQTAAVDELESEVASLRNRQQQYQHSLPIGWVGGAIAVCLVGGFLLGTWWVDHRSRKRHGGIRVY